MLLSFSAIAVCLQLCFVGVVYGKCIPTNCLNGGLCDPSYAGSGFRCICPKINRADYGPRCEVLTRSFTPVKIKYHMEYTATWHDIDPTFRFNEFVTISFEFVGHCPDYNCSIVLITGKKLSPIVQLDLQRDGRVTVQHTGPESKKNPNQFAKTTLPSVEPAGKSGYWRSISFMLQTGKIPGLSGGQSYKSQTVYCSLRYSKCEHAELKGASPLNPRDKGKHTKLRIGLFDGCIRYMRLNSRPVDLGIVFSFHGIRSGTQPFCSAQSGSCNYPGSNKPVCGRDSVCYGAVTPSSRSKAAVDCTCRCLSGKRRERGTIANAGSCIANPSEPPNECKIDSPILNVGYLDFNVLWTLQDNGLIPIYGSKGTNDASVSFEAEFKTRQRWKKQRLLELWNSSRYFITLTVTETGGRQFLKLCIGTDCVNMNIANNSFSDGHWHRVHASIRHREIIFSVDGFTKRFQNLIIDILKKSYKVVLTAPHTCVRNIRTGNIFMPMTEGDSTADSGGHVRHIKMHKARGAVALSKCDEFTINKPYRNPTPAPPRTTDAKAATNSTGCRDCSHNEICWESPEKPAGECRCKHSYKRNASGACVADQLVLEKLVKESKAASAQWPNFVRDSMFILLLWPLICEYLNM